MSYESWCKEFMPINFREVTKENENAWILQKWKGARKENLEKHEMTLKDDCIYDKSNFVHYIFDGCRCPWCKENNDVTACRHCPPVLLGLIKCCGDPSPYYEFTHKGDPEPMIKWIEKAIKLIE